MFIIFTLYVRKLSLFVLFVCLYCFFTLLGDCEMMSN